MVSVGLLVVLEANPGKEDDLASFLARALPLVQHEPQTTARFAARDHTNTVRSLRHLPRRRGT
jgi:hypothetical protein